MLKLIEVRQDRALEVGAFDRVLDDRKSHGRGLDAVPICEKIYSRLPETEKKAKLRANLLLS